MANVKFSALPNATTLTGTEQSVTLQGGVASLVTPAQTATYLEVTQSPGDASTLLATDAFVANAIATVNPASSVDWATAAVLPNTPTYNNGTAGVGATLTSATNTTLTVDSNAVALNDRVLVKNQASTFQNGVYYQSQLGTGSVPWILTRAVDYNTASNINYTGTIPVIGGTANALTNWLLTSFITAIGTPNAITYTQQTTGGTSGGGGSSNVKGKPPFTKGDIIVGLGGNSLGASGSIVVDPNASANIVPSATPATTAVGYLGAPINEQDGDYTLAMTDAGKTVRANLSGAHTYTIPTNASVAFPLGTVIVIRNGAGSSANLTLSPAGGVNLWQAGNNISASLVMGASSLVTIVKEATNDWMLTGTSTAGGGSSFPGTPATGSLFFRTDRGLQYYYDGTRWLTVNEYTTQFICDAAQPISSTNSYRGDVPYAGVYSFYAETMYWSAYVNTTNDGTHYWGFTLNPGAVSTFNTSALGTTSFTTQATAINALVTITSTLSIDTAKTSTPGTMFFIATLVGRLVG